MHWLDYWVDHYPDDWHGHFYRADICHGAGVVDRARADFERVLELNPDQSEARRLLASILTNSGQDLDQAIRHWEIYEKSHPDNPEVLAGLARCHHGLGDLKAAKASLEQLLAKNPNHAGGLLWLAQVEADLDRPEEALASLKRLDGLTLDNLPDIQRSVALRANVHRRLGHTREAEFYEKRMEEIKADVVELGRTSEPLVKGGASSPALRLRMGQLYFRLGLEEEAKRWFETVLQEAPDHVEAHRALAEFYQKRTDPVSRSRAEYHRRAAAGSSP
jgi:tetratricopeptide (TPR) repeat protein